MSRDMAISAARTDVDEREHSFCEDVVVNIVTECFNHVSKETFR
jgi:hypothetical protein